MENSLKEILESYLDTIPVPNIKTRNNAQGMVELIVPKYKRNWTKRIANFLGWPLYVYVELDQLGTFAWRHFDGKSTVREIAIAMSNDGVEEAPFRLALFVRYLYQKGWIQLLRPDKDNNSYEPPSTT